LLDSAINLQQDSCYTYHRTLRMSLQYLAKLLLRIRLTFGKLLMMFVGVSKFGKTNLIFVDPAVKFNGTYWTRLTTKYGETCRRKTKVYDVGSSVCYVWCVA